MRSIVFALAAAALLPGIAAAQAVAPPLVDAPAAPRFTFSPFIGYAFTSTQKGTVAARVRGQLGTADYERQIGGGVMAGATMEARVSKLFSVVGMAAVNPRGTVRTRTGFADLEDREQPGGTYWIARAGLQLGLRETDPGMQQHTAVGALSVSPAVIRQQASDAYDAIPSATRYGMNAAATVELPLPWKGFAVRAVAEDYMLFGDDPSASVQMSEWVTRKAGSPALAQISAGAVHLYAVRAGLSYHF